MYTYVGKYSYLYVPILFIKKSVCTHTLYKKSMYAYIGMYQYSLSKKYVHILYVYARQLLR
jgi:hypothetical protein